MTALALIVGIGALLIILMLAHIVEALDGISQAMTGIAKAEKGSRK